MNITKQRLEQLIKEEYNIFLDELPPEELEELLFEESTRAMLKERENKA